MARNSFFRFKQFTVNQDKCAMKVCTDACVLGAWADLEGSGKILDIGTGTGLLALMVAQRNTFSEIDAVELDPDAFSQAVGNVEKSAFHSRINVVNSSIQDFVTDEKYECIITNPPFFQSDLLSPHVKKNQAHHAVSLSFDELLISMERLLSQTGRYNILLPTDESEIFNKKVAGLGWVMSRKLILCHDPTKKPFRQLMTFQRNQTIGLQVVIENLYIFEKDGKTYSPEFKELMKDFYLIF